MLNRGFNNQDCDGGQSTMLSRNAPLVEEVGIMCERYPIIPQMLKEICFSFGFGVYKVM